jgi:hypothetical protein
VMGIRNIPKILILFQISRATLCRQPHSTTTAAGTKRNCRNARVFPKLGLDRLCHQPAGHGGL